MSSITVTADGVVIDGVLLAVFDDTNDGLVPASPGGTSDFLRADGTWATPGGGPGAVEWGDITGTLSDQTDLQDALDLKADTSSLAAVATSGAYNDLSGKPTLGTAAAQNTSAFATAAQGTTADSALQPAGNGSSLTGLTKAQVGLSNVDNTSDANKPVSTATQTALNLKANLASPTFTGTVSGITAAMVGAPSGSGSSSGTNTGDNATNSQYSGLAASKQDTLVSATNIKTINGASVLGSGDLSVSAGDPTYTPGSFTVATGTGRLVINHLILASSERATLQGTGRLAVAF